MITRILKTSFLLLSGVLFSQQVAVSGQIETEQNTKIPFASVVFQERNTESNLKGVITDDEGTFNIKLKRGLYDVRITVVGINTASYTLDLTNAKQKYNAGVFKVDSTLKLDEVILTGEENIIEILPDKKVYNVSKDPAASGASITGIMENLPSVQVDNGTIAIRGDQNVTLLVDGHPNGMTKNLDAFPANMIERIEVITSPGAKYEARGGAGIINIILKKGGQYEYNSSSEFFTSYPISAGVNANLSQVGKKGNWYLNLGTGYSQPTGRNFITLDTPEKEVKYTKQKTERTRKQKYVLINTGKSYEVNKNTQLNGSISIKKANSDNFNTVNYEDQLNNGQVQDSQREENEDESADMYQGTLSIDKKFGKKASISASVNGEISKINKESTIQPQNRFGETESNYPNTTDKYETQKTLGASIDYSKNVNEKISFDIGYKLDYNDLGSDFKVNQVENNTFVEIDEFTNVVNYAETVHAGYAEVKINLEKEMWTLGLRGEKTGIDITAQKGSFNQIKNYFDLFPSIRYLRQLNEKTRLQLALYRRIQRAPRSTRWILPYSTFTDNRNMFVGNPDIDPSYITGIEAELILRLSKKVVLYPTLFYRLKKDETELYIEKRNVVVGNREVEIYTSSLVNIGDYHAFGGELAYRLRPSKKLSIRGEVLFNGFHQVGNYNGVDFSGDGLMISGKIIATYYFSKTLDFQIRNYYDGPARAGQYDMKGRFRTNMDIQKKIFKGQGRILLGMQDVFNSNFRRVVTRGEGFERLLELQNRIPQVAFSITYRFNQKRYRGKKGNQFDDYEVVN